MGKLQVIVGGQFGSEAKGHVAGYLATKESDLFAIRTGGPNAGHTVMWEGAAYKLRQIPAAAITNETAMVGISAGSEIDPAVLQSEADMLEATLPNKLWHRLIIDSQATVIEPSHLGMEKALVESIGSTGKGIGAARADRIMRTARIWADTSPAEKTNVAGFAHNVLEDGGTVQIEAAQGYGLGLHAGYYPQCTSGDCRAIDALAMAGLSPWDPLVTSLEVWVVFRVYPIRVAGNSGPLYNETSWANLGLPQEHTTVTGNVRRVGHWDQQLADAAMAANGENVNVALMMFDQVEPEAKGVVWWDQLSRKAQDTLSQYDDCVGNRIQLVGTGPDTVIDLSGGA